MFKVSTTYLNKEVNFETFGDAVDFVENEVKDRVDMAMDDGQIDKYAVEDILWRLKENIIKNRGYYYPDLTEEWSIEEE